ncbi:MAG TPA: SpoIID/LytB domain-containing protein [Gemmatimonadales bacterium]|nr:SpoIID/LytB domain-containing protein [Gemmatimonadales bacterium]
MRHSLKRAALAVSLAAALGCPGPSAPPALPGVEPELRIAIATGGKNASIGGAESGELFVSDAGTGLPIGSVAAGTRWVIVPDSADPSRLRIVRPDSTRTAPLRGVAVVNVTENRFVEANGRRYRGRINVTSSRDGLTLVNRVNLEGYLAGVVGPEIGPRRPDETAAVLAQAVVSRSFALKNRGRWDAFGFDAYADTRDQVYLGVAAETDQAWDGVRRTAGQVLEYDGEVIDAYFHSTCGFSTAGVEEAFATARTRPYLRPVSDARGGGGGHYYCDISPRFRWREEWDRAKLRAILSRTLATITPLSGDGLPRITDVAVSRTTPSGRVGELHIVFERGDVRIPGPDVRTVLRPDPDRILASSAFQLVVTRGPTGEVDRLIAAGAGSGHGVGMCQWGAIGRARDGQDYQKILTTYFPGTKIAKLY